MAFSIMQNFVMLSVIMLSVVMLSVVAPMGMFHPVNILADTSTSQLILFSKFLFFILFRHMYKFFFCKIIRIPNMCLFSLYLQYLLNY